MREDGLRHMIIRIHVMKFDTLDQLKLNELKAPRYLGHFRLLLINVIYLSETFFGKTALFVQLVILKYF